MSYYDEFGPAVMAACGQGFTNPVSHSIPALDTFLLEGTASFDCRSLGEKPRVIAIDNFQSATRNLMLAAAAIWRKANDRKGLTAKPPRCRVGTATHPCQGAEPASPFPVFVTAALRARRS